MEQDQDGTKRLVPLVSRPRWDMKRPYIFFLQISNFWDRTRTETSGKIKKRTSLRPRLINNQNWSQTETSACSLETETRLRVSPISGPLPVSFFLSLLHERASVTPTYPFEHLMSLFNLFVKCHSSLFKQHYQAPET